jgi:four helix bundle protein
MRRPRCYAPDEASQIKRPRQRLRGKSVSRGISTASGYRDLLAWQEAIKLAVMVYRATSRFPREEIYGLTAQVRKSAVSIPSNIAEGAARNSARELHHFLGVSAGSLAEVETQLELAAQLEYAERDAAIAQQAQKVGMLLTGLRRSCAGRADSI